MSGSARTLARAGMVVTTAYLLSRLLGWLRTVVFSSIYGASPDLDAYFAAFRIPDLVFQLVAAGALSSALIPVIASLIANDEEARSWRVVATVANLMLIALVVLSGAMAVLAPWIVPAITPGFGPAQTELTIELTRIMLFSPILLALGALATSILNARDRFSVASMAPIAYNAVIIVFAVVLAPVVGIEGLAVAVVLGSLAHLLVQLPAIVRMPGFRFRLTIDIRDSAAREAFLLMGPRALGLGVSQITFLVNTSLASTLATGSIVAYNVAFTILQIPLGVIGIPLGVVLLPSMSRAIALGDAGRYARLIVRSLRLLLYVMLFLTAMTIVLREQVVTLLFDYGNFNARAVDLTAQTLLFFGLGLAGHAMIVVLARSFYADKDTRTPVMAAILSVVVNVTISVALVGSLGLAGLALGIAAGAWFEATLLAALLWRRTPTLRGSGIVRAGIVFGLGAVLAGLVALGLAQATALLFGPGFADSKILVLVQTGTAVAGAAAAYVGYSLVLRLPEFRETLAIAVSALRRERPVS
ncbi:MAG: murein biosynthesis integral membrane protein MurJ [Candidatus Limnocylindrales bacterium]